MEPMRSAASGKINGPFDLLKRVTILITVKTTNQTSTGEEAPGKACPSRGRPAAREQLA